MSEIVLVVGDKEWEGLYVDGKLKREDHALGVEGILDALGIEYEYILVGDVSIWEKWNGRLPPRLSTVRKDTMLGGWPG